MSNQKLNAKIIFRKTALNSRTQSDCGIFCIYHRYESSFMYFNCIFIIQEILIAPESLKIALIPYLIYIVSGLAFHSQLGLHTNRDWQADCCQKYGLDSDKVGLDH